MTELRFTRKAVEDLSDIWRYTVERWSEEQADRYYGLLVATCRKIAASTVPIGRRYEQIAEGLYGFRVGRHILFYTNGWTSETVSQSNDRTTSSPQESSPLRRRLFHTEATIF